MFKEIENWVQRGSGWVIDGPENVYLDFAKYVPNKGGGYVPLPTRLRNKQAIINIKNKDFTGVSSPTPLNEISLR